MKNFLILGCLILFNHSLCLSQDTKPTIKNKKIKIEVVGKRSSIKKTKAQNINISKQKKVFASKEGELNEGHLNISKSKRYNDSLRQKRNYIKYPYPKSKYSEKYIDSLEKDSKNIKYLMSVGGCPPDNAFGISNKGYIVAANNKEIRFGIFSNETGLNMELNGTSWEGFFDAQINSGDLDLSSTDEKYIFTDPRIYYSPQRDQFFLVILLST
jgi:hypothetical protein